MFSSHFYGLGSHLRVEEKVSGGGGASHDNTQSPFALLRPVPFLQCAGGMRDGKFATRRRKLPTGLVENDRGLFRGREESHTR